MNADQVIKIIIKKLEKIVKEMRKRENPGDGDWTREILTELGNLGEPKEFPAELGGPCERKNFSVCASQGKFGFAKADWGEFLCDITWAQNDRPSKDKKGKWDVKAQMKVLVLAGECEWGTYEYVLEDFQKLLVVRATVRLMIYDVDRAKSQTNKRLMRHIRAFCGRESGDHYLLVARTGNGENVRLKLAKVVVDDDRSAKLTRL